jgi:hypothetical protein
MDTDVFISYRRGDEPAFVFRLHGLLKNALPHHEIFIDVEAIPLGDRFAEHIVWRVAKSSVFLPVIGPRWLLGAGETSSRLFDSNDLVRKELEAALVCKTTIVPLLVDSTPMPSPESLPRSVAGVCARNATRLSHARFSDDAKPLIRTIKGVVKHHIQKQLTIAEFEAYELGKRAGKDVFERITRGIKASFDHLSRSMVERFLEKAAPVIANRDHDGLQSLIDNFGREARLRKAELIVGTIDYVCEDLSHLGVSPNEPTDPLFVAIEDQVQRELDDHFSGMMDAISVPLAKQIEAAGWRF